MKSQGLKMSKFRLVSGFMPEQQILILIRQVKHSTLIVDQAVTGNICGASFRATVRSYSECLRVFPVSVPKVFFERFAAKVFAIIVPVVAGADSGDFAELFVEILGIRNTNGRANFPDRKRGGVQE